MIFRTALVITVVLMSATTAAQYKYTGPDGRVIYSDTPPPAAPKGAKPLAVQKKDLAASVQSSGSTPLPFVLQQASRNFPVTLFAAADCGGCDQGRAYLNKRGVPFSEKLVKSNQDIDEMKKLTGATAIPVLKVGSNQQAGVGEAEWGALLDTAGYPTSNQLPPGYKAPAATAVVPEKPPATAAAKPKPEEAAPPPPPPAAADAGPRPGWFKGF